MKLDPDMAALFFKLIDGLHFFVNQKLGLCPEVVDVKNYRKSPRESIFKVREALYGNIHLVDEFVANNPYNFSAEELGVILSWKKYIKGTFYIERFLKPHAIFIDNANDKVYGVLGISNGLDEFIDKSRLPLMVDTVLLPFMGKIIYDGFFGYSNIHFGKGISAEFKDTYLTAKQNNNIVTNLEKNDDDPIFLKSSNPPAKNWSSEIKQLIILADQLKGGGGQPTLASPAFSMIKASLEFANLAIDIPTDIEKLHKCLKKVERATKQAREILYRNG